MAGMREAYSMRRSSTRQESRKPPSSWICVAGTHRERPTYRGVQNSRAAGVKFGLNYSDKASTTVQRFRYPGFAPGNCCSF
jgi:hypothetical protein